MIHDAVKIVHPNAVTISTGNDIIEAWDESGKLINIDKNKIDIEIDRLKHEHHKKQYQRSRKTEYPSIEDQLDMLWHAIDEGKLDKNSEFYTSIKTVKNKYKKP